jgi:L,D-peptidoglycan transpeptidase YkuD (ErfK/YbiS/YcfS/YnhG family)
MRDGRIQLTVVLILALHCGAAAAPIQADKIVILKCAHSMTLFSGSKVLKTYKVALGSVPVGPKQVEGDHKTPEGEYVIDSKNSIANSICRCTSPIPARQINKERAASVHDQAAQS